MKRFRDFLREADIMGMEPKNRSSGPNWNSTFSNIMRGNTPSHNANPLGGPPSPAYGGSSSVSPRGPMQIGGDKSISRPNLNLEPKDVDSYKQFTPHSPRNPGDSPRDPGGLQPGGKTYNDLHPGDDEPLAYRTQDKRENVPTSAEGGRKSKRKK